MRKVCFVMFLGAFFSVLSAQEQQKGLCKVNKTNGVYVFTDSEPIGEYEILDRVKSTVSWSAQYNAVKSKLVRKAVNDYPDADGVICSMNKGGTDRAVVIKFKRDTEEQKAKVGLAVANKVNGIYVFTDAEPVMDYEILDREKSGISWSGQYSEIRNRLIKKALKGNKSAEGVILTFSTGGMDRAVVMKYK